MSSNSTITQQNKRINIWQKIFANPYLLLILTVLFWAGNSVVVRSININVSVNKPLPPQIISLGRWIIMMFLLIPLTYKYFSQWRILIPYWKTILILSITGITIFNSFAYIALQYTSATNMVLLNSFIPIVTVLIGWIFYQRKISLIQFIGIMISMLGVIMIISRGNVFQLLLLNINRGDIWLLLAVIDWAIYTVIIQNFRVIPPLFLLMVITVIGTIILLPFSIYEYISFQPLNWSLPNILVILYIGIFPAFLGYIFYNRGIAAIGAYRGSMFIHLMPVFGSLLAWAFLDEKLYSYHLIGIIAIFCGIALTIYINKKN